MIIKVEDMKKLLLCVLLLTVISIGGCVDKEAKKTQISTIDLEQTITVPVKTLSLEETIESYFLAKYDIYTSMQYVDLRYYLDLSYLNNENYTRWLKNLVQRRKVIEENQYFFVEKEQKDFEINFNDAPEDNRMDFYEERDILPEFDKIVHFTITAKTDSGYPPFFALNDQHTMALKKVKNRWKILFHYFPGSSRHRSRDLIDIISKEEMEVQLLKEVQNTKEVQSSLELSKGIVYDGLKASEYAKKYINSHNSRFYTIDDWMGNCANFTSQVLLYGFSKSENINVRDYMTDKWYAGYGGGSPAWENVGYFWDFLIKDQPGTKEGMYGYTVNNVNMLDVGGIAQIKSKISREESSFSHNLVLVNKDKLLFAQNSPDCFIYYSDLVNVDLRFFNPKRLIVD